MSLLTIAAVFPHFPSFEFKSQARIHQLCMSKHLGIPKAIASLHPYCVYIYIYMAMNGWLLVFPIPTVDDVAGDVFVVCQEHHIPITNHE